MTADRASADAENPFVYKIAESAALDPEEARAALAQQEASGLSPSAFAEREGRVRRHVN